MQGTWGKVRVEGFKELHEALTKLPEEVGKKIGEDATRAGANVIKDAVKARVPIGPTGNLYRSITTWKKTKGGGSWIATGTGALIQFSVGGRGKRGKHLHLVEQGTKPHWVVAGGKEWASSITVSERGRRQLIVTTGRKKALYDRVAGRFWGRRQYVHPKAHPFMTPAFFSSKDAAINRVKKGLTDGIEKAFKRMTK